VATVPDRALFRRFPRLAETLPIVPLLTGPTPVRRLAPLEDELGVAELWIKDDGRCAPPYGGNKPRKLEWLLGDARARGFERVVAIGGDGSNYCLATAIHGTRAGFDVTLITMPQPPIEEVRRNLRAGVATGAEYVPTGSDAALVTTLARRVVSGSLRGRRPYATWFGGSSPLGAVGFVEAALELMDQVAAGELPRPDVVFLPTGSVGSHAGLELGLRLHAATTDDPEPPPSVVGVRVTPEVLGNPRLVAWTANRCMSVLRAADPGLPRLRIAPKDVTVREGFFGEAYGVGTRAGMEAMERLGPLGVGLDPTYSAKTMAALLAAGEAGELRGRRALFWVTFNACPLDDLPAGDLADLPESLRRRVDTLAP